MYNANLYYLNVLINLEKPTLIYISVIHFQMQYHVSYVAFFSYVVYRYKIIPFLSLANTHMYAYCCIPVTL